MASSKDEGGFIETVKTVVYALFDRRPVSHALLPAVLDPIGVDERHAAGGAISYSSTKWLTAIRRIHARSPPARSQGACLVRA